MKKTNTRRRVLSILFAFVMVLSVSIVGTLAASAEESATDVAKIGDVSYPTFGEALTAVKNGETITLLTDCAESVTIKQATGKSFTVDGNGKTYTGTITIDGASNSKGTETLTFYNFTFSAANSIIGTKTAPHNVRFEKCDFITSSGYSLQLKNLYNWSFIDCTATGSGAFMQVSASPTQNLYVEGFEAEIGGNVFKIDYCTTEGATATFKDVTIKSGVVGFYISNRNSGAINFVDVSATCQYPVYIWDRSTGIATPLDFKGENTFSSTAGNDWLTAKEGTASVTGAENIRAVYGVAKVGGTYYASLPEAVDAASLVLGGATVELLRDVTISEKITVSGDVTICGAYTLMRERAYTGSLFEVNAGASLTLDGGLILDGNNNYAFDKDAFLVDANENWNEPIQKEESDKWFTPEAGAPVASAYMITTTGGAVNLYNVTIQNNYSVSYGVVSVGTGSTVTLTGARISHVAATQSGGVVVNASGAEIAVTVNEGTLIEGNHAGSNHGLFKIYSGAVMTLNGGEIKNNTAWNSNGVAIGVYWGSLYINGGIICSNIGTYGPANGRNAAIYLHSGHTFVMSGGTVCHNSGRARGGIDAPYDNGSTIITGGEVLENISRGNGSTYDVLGTSAMQISGGVYTQDVSEWCAPGFTVVMLQDGTYGVVHDPLYGKEARIGDTYYATFAEALDAAVSGDVIVVYKTVVIDEDGTVDLKGARVNAGETIHDAPVFRILANVTFTNGIVDGYGDGSGSTNAYAFIVGNADVAGMLTVIDGTYRGVTSAISITNGVVNILGGTFQTKHDGEGTDYGTTYLLNCIDAAYDNGTAKFNITGGKFVGFNPENNAAEGAGTNFLSDGYKASDYYDNDKWYVARALVVLDEDKYFETVKDALAILLSADTEVHTVKLLDNIEIDVNYSTYNYPILVNGFVLVLDLNGKTMTADWSAYSGTRKDNALIGVCNGGKLTVTDSVGGGKIINNDTNSGVENRIFWIMTGTATKELIVNIDGGIFVQNDINTVLLYIQGNANSTDMGVYVNINGGHFESVNADFFNAYDGHIYEAWITGGTFASDPTDSEIRISEDSYLFFDELTELYTVRPLIRFSSTNLLIGNTIGMYFNLDSAELLDGVNYVAVFTIHGEEYIIPRYDENGNLNWEIREDNPATTKILFEGIAAKEMTLQINIVLMIGDTVVSRPVSDSIKGYVERGIKLGVFDEGDMDLIIQMINYGALAQQSFGYKTGDLANSGEYVTASAEEYTREDGVYVNKLDAEGYYGASLNLENNIGFNFKFYKDGIENAEKAVITYVSHTGKKYEIVVGVSDFKLENKQERDIWVVHLDTLVAADAREMLKCEILDKDGNVLAYANDSIESYCARAIAGLSAMSVSAYSEQSFMIEFYQALMKYATAAYEYDPYTKN